MAPEIRKRLTQWVDGNISLREFQEWFVPATWNIHLANDPEAEGLADDIEMALSQYTSRVLPIEDLRRELAKAARPFVVQQVRIIAMSAAPPQEVRLNYDVTRKKPQSETVSTVQEFVVGR